MTWAIPGQTLFGYPEVYYERIYLLRRRELDWLVEHMPVSWQIASSNKVFLDFRYSRSQKNGI